MTNIQKQINRIAKNVIDELTSYGVVVNDDYLKSCIRDAIYNSMSEEEYERITKTNQD